SILPLVPGLCSSLEDGIDVLDVGCGSGRALNLLARGFPRSHFTGYDLLPEQIAAARAEARECGLENVRFPVRDVADIQGPAAFTSSGPPPLARGTACDATRDPARPDVVLRAVARALRPRGVFLMQDIRGSSRVEKDLENPMASFLYTVSCLHCMTVSLAAGGAGLGSMWGAETACRMLDEAGFAKVELRQRPHHPTNLYYVAPH